MDLKAKAPVQYFRGDNCYCGCFFCEHKGEHLNKHYYPYQTKQNRIDRTKETIQTVYQHMNDSNSSDITEIIKYSNIFSIMVWQTDQF